MRNPFFLFKKIARGGMAEIYLGKMIGEDSFERVCCIKRILPQFSKESEYIEMFRDEAHIGKRLQHANIVRVEGFEEVEGAFAIIMEFINGADLRVIMESVTSQEQVWSVPIAVYIIAEAARGLHFAHTKKDDITNQPLGIIHRDISPQNLLLSFSGEVKVTDFGIANADNRNTETKTGIVKGKFSYMSPEQISAQPLDARTDVFALGIILWEMLTGRRLFQADSEVLTIQLVRDCLIPKDFKSYNGDINDELERIVFRSLSKNLNDRQRDAGEFEKELRIFLNRYYPQFTQDDLGVFLKNLLPKRQADLSSSIKELLSRKVKGSYVNKGKSNSFQKTSMNTVNYRKPKEAATRAHYPPNPRQTIIRNQNVKGNLSRKQTYKSPGTRVATSSSGSPKVFLLLISFLLAGAVFSGFYYYKNVYSVLPSWTIRTLPERAKLIIDGVQKGKGGFLKTPYQIKGVSREIHRLKILRDGFVPYEKRVNFTSSRGNIETIAILDKASGVKWAPVVVVLEDASQGVNVIINEGLFEGYISSDKEHRVEDLVLAKEYIMKIIISEHETFACTFTPYAQRWESPFKVLISLTKRRCEYPP